MSDNVQQLQQQILQVKAVAFDTHMALQQQQQAANQMQEILVNIGKIASAVGDDGKVNVDTMMQRIEQAFAPKRPPSQGDQIG